MTAKKISSLTDTMINKIEIVKADVQQQIFQQWCSITNTKSREDLYAKACVLDDVCFALIKNIRGGE